MDWIALYNSDAHSKKMVGTFYNVLDAPDGPPADEGALGRLLRCAEVRGFQDEARMLDHRSDELIAGERVVLQPELFVLGLPLPNQFTRLQAEHAQHGIQLFRARWVLEVFPDLRLDAVFTQQADRLPGLASAGVMPNSNAHRATPRHA